MEEIINTLIDIYSAEKVKNTEDVNNNKYYILEDVNKCDFLKCIKFEDIKYNYIFIITKNENKYNVKSTFVYEEIEEQFTNIKNVLKYIEEQLKLESFSKNAFKYLKRIINGEIQGENFSFKNNINNSLKYDNYKHLLLFELYSQIEQEDVIILTPSDEFKKAYGNN